MWYTISMMIKKTFTISENNVKALNAESIRLGISVSDVLRRLIDEKLGQVNNAKDI